MIKIFYLLFIPFLVSLTAGLVDVDRAVIDIARNEGLQSFHNHQAPA